VHDLIGPGQQEICCARIARSNGHFEAGHPSGVSRADDNLRNRHLARITQADRCHRIQAPSELVAAGRGEAASDLKRDRLVAKLSEAHELLGHAGLDRKPRLA